MAAKDKIDVNIFKTITRTILQSDDMESLGNRLTNILVSQLDIKGATIFALNPETEELEILASFGLSINFINKGPVTATKSGRWASERKPVVVSDITKSDGFQYPDHIKKEGIAAIVSIPIIFHGKIIGLLRLYHYEIWNISEQDIDTLNAIAEGLAMAMLYSRILNALLSVKNTVNDVHSIWLKPQKR
ncbi:MAG: GAF domain-containing protein [Desulfobacterales bacterium]|nr:GAF domain-containing protein [Desulfobacterales bacterium]